MSTKPETSDGFETTHSTYVHLARDRKPAPDAGDVKGPTMSTFVMLENSGDDVILTIAEQKSDYSTENLSQHRIPKLHVTSFDKLDGELSRIGYRRIGDWMKIPNGGIANVVPVASVTEAPVRDAPGQGDHGVLVDVESGERLGPATARQLKYASQSSDNTLRIDSKGQPFANGSSSWLQKNTRHVQIRNVPAGAIQRAFKKDTQTTAQAQSAPTVLAQTSASIGNITWQYMRRKDLVNGALAAVDLDGERALVFSSGPGEQVTLRETDIAEVTKVGSGFNIVVDVVYGDPLIEPGFLCFVGPRGRMKTIFATLGHPI